MPKTLDEEAREWLDIILLPSIRAAISQRQEQGFCFSKGRLRRILEERIIRIASSRDITIRFAFYNDMYQGPGTTGVWVSRVPLPKHFKPFQAEEK